MVNASIQSDERIAKRASVGGAREDRASSDRGITENRETTDSVRLAERLSILRDVETKLPRIPEIPGYHTCWLTTTNSSDTLEHRFRLGYELIHPSELPGFLLPTQQSGGASSDRIMVNEMVAAKLSKDLAEAYIKHLHHDLPSEQLRNLRESAQITRDGRGNEIGYTGADRDGDFRNGVSDGFRTLTKSTRPSFDGVL